ncbi:hypothetical protein EVAR_86539_1 [Eumeta japonica]|uniref:Uncharacterized protein n=1 Tax=Eumeta variegata TaxID=151549 RepID=A0A4C1VPR3_EUMVA|nr:hypothetical protein EVAR_86539_1 [Eumeta japonica]
MLSRALTFIIYMIGIDRPVSVTCAQVNRDKPISEHVQRPVERAERRRAASGRALSQALPIRRTKVEPRRRDAELSLLSAARARAAHTAGALKRDCPTF